MWCLLAAILLKVNYVKYIVAMQLYFSRLQTAALSTGETTMSIV